VALSVLASYHAERPIELGAPLQWLRSRLDTSDEISTALVQSLSDGGTIVLADGLARLASFTPRLDAGQETLRASLLVALESAASEPPSVEELAVAHGVSRDRVAELLRWLAREKVLIAVESDRYYAAEAVNALRARLAAGMTEPREYTPAELRGMLGLTRKFLIPFLEYCDREGYTIRAGLGRRLRT
jgi:selenocysteine-specific elongation factor